MRKGDETRARLVGRTAELLQRQGYHATGLAQIVEHSGAPRGSLYFHFPGGKEELACAALDEAGDAWRTRLEAVIAAAPDPAAALDAVCRTLADALRASGWQDGCPLATVALEAAGESERVRSTVAAHYAGWERLIAGRLGGLGVPPREAARLATFTLASIEGALLLARVRRDDAPLRAAAEVLRAVVATRLGAASAPAARATRRKTAGARAGSGSGGPAKKRRPAGG